MSYAINFAGNEFLIPLYDLVKDDTVVEKWIKGVDKLAERYGWDDNSIMILIASRLRGNARQWYDEQATYDVSWSEIKHDMIEQFHFLIYSEMLLIMKLVQVRVWKIIVFKNFQSKEP